MMKFLLFYLFAYIKHLENCNASLLRTIDGWERLHEDDIRSDGGILTSEVEWDTVLPEIVTGKKTRRLNAAVR